MKIKICIFLASIAACLNTYCQTIVINSITAYRQSSGDNGYTLDGLRMASGSRLKLLNINNFGLGGIYPKNISLVDGFGTTGSLINVSTLPANNIFFFGSFNKLDPSTQQFTNGEIDSLYNWSKRGGKLIIASGITYFTAYDASMLNIKWGYTWTQNSPNSFIPNQSGNETDIFNGPFGSVTTANQGAGAQGYFASIPTNSKILATDINGNTTLFMDCNTLDLIIADVDGFTDLGGITQGVAINNVQDKFWANTIVFMDKLQPPPFIINSSNNLTLNSTYNNYQWYLNDIPINGALSQNYTVSTPGSYHVEVTLNGGCNYKSNTIKIELVIPNVFTPNNDGINDNFKILSNNILAINFKVYNRWGIKVAELTQPNEVWDGVSTSGLQCKEGFYYWVIEYQNSNGASDAMTGFLQLIR
ncbi:MAG: gliding motility-associated C-terminal domain-containing protein [Bacteroidetes bacterium]|nr:gliding motility-associated C-terminal domain-containing protein [Bacteroidota bacterium]